MKPLKMDHSNVTYGAADCEDLPATVAYGCTMTYWEPSDVDRARIAAGGHVRLSIVGSTVPPLMLDTED